MTSRSKSPLYISFAEKLLRKRQSHSVTASIKTRTINYINELADFFFPHCSERVYYSEEDVLGKLQLIKRDLIILLESLNGNLKGNPDEIAEKFVEKIPAIHDMLWNDAEYIFNGDPAAENIDEVILAYPGFKAITIYRIAHILHNLEVPIIPRIMTEFAHEKTGVDIHPGAQIASPFFIDHGTGIVIGETTVIGKKVKIYQGVTLGALSVDKSLAQTKRHPTIEDNVILYSQAVILGGNTTIGNNSVIGGNSWITSSVDPYSLVYNTTQVIVRAHKEENESINFII